MRGITKFILVTSSHFSILDEEEAKTPIIYTYIPVKIKNTVLFVSIFASPPQTVSIRVHLIPKGHNKLSPSKENSIRFYAIKLRQPKEHTNRTTDMA